MLFSNKSVLPTICENAAPSLQQTDVVAYMMTSAAVTAGTLTAQPKECQPGSTNMHSNQLDLK